MPAAAERDDASMSPSNESPAPQPVPQYYNLPPAPISVLTPASNDQIFQSTVYTKPTTKITLIGTGTQGVDHISRIQMALNSGLHSEISWAVRALLEVSNRSADTIKERNSINVLDLLTRYILSKWSDATDEVGLGNQETDKNAAARNLVSEAVLALRNFSLDAELARTLGNTPGVRVIVENGLLLPGVPAFFELRTTSLDLAEHLAIYISNESASRLFSPLVTLLESEDRSSNISASRTLSRLCVYDEKNTILNLGTSQLSTLLGFLLVDDEELIASSLDLLYQYTSRITHLEELVTAISGSPFDAEESVWVKDLLSVHLIRLLTYKMSTEPKDYIRLPRRTKKPAPAEPPKLSPEVLKELLALWEPDRATNWIRSSYEPDDNGEVTQISLWKAYEGQFESYVRQGRRLLPAVDFIKNVTTAFRNAAAMVVNLPNGQKKFVIKGIKPREMAVLPSVYNKSNVQSLPDLKRQGPPPFGPSAALLLQNISRLQGSRAFLRPYVRAIVEAGVHNPGVLTYVDGILSHLDAGS